MGSLSAMKRGGKERYFQSEAKKFVPEGIEGKSSYKRKIRRRNLQLTGGIRAGMGYCGTKISKHYKRRKNGDDYRFWIENLILTM